MDKHHIHTNNFPHLLNTFKAALTADESELDLTLDDGSKFELIYDNDSISNLLQRHHENRQSVLPYEVATANFAALCAEVKATGDYKSARERYRALSFELNIHGKQAPAFRKKLETGKKLNDPVFLQIHRDNITIDCHWLWCTRAEVHVNEADNEFAPLFDYSIPFDFDLADNFASKKWKTENRTLEVLRLIDFYQVQCSALNSDTLKSRIKSLDQPRKEAGKRIPSIRSNFEKRLLTWGASVKNVQKHYSTYRALWTIHMLLGSSINNRMLSTLTALALGQPRKDPKTVKTQLNTLLQKVVP